MNKKIIYSIFTIIFFYSCTKNNETIYHNKATDFYSFTSILKLKNGNVFERISLDYHSKDGFTSKGKYLFKKDTLILYCKGIIQYFIKKDSALYLLPMNNNIPSYNYGDLENFEEELNTFKKKYSFHEE